MNRKTLFFISLVIVLALAAMLYLPQDNSTLKPRQDKPAQPSSLIRPEFSLPDLQGNMRNINEWDGQYIVLNFWATWCPPCRKEIPEFIALQEEYAEANLQFIGIAIDNEASVKQFAFDMGINYPNLIAEMDGIELARQYGNIMGALPFSVIISPKGQILTHQFGLLERSTILKVTQLSKS